MAFKKNIYISGPRMGTNNSMYGIDAASINKKKKSKSKGNKNGSRKRS
jgi:ribosome assembly protein YihI (activator of Der GTPase)